METEQAANLHAEITICEPDQKVKVEAPSATPNDPLYAQQWNMKAIGVDKAWAKGQLGDPQRRVSTSQLTLPYSSMCGLLQIL